MPTYRCTTPQGLLDTERKGSIAREITPEDAANAITGAATFFCPSDF